MQVICIETDPRVLKSNKITEGRVYQVIEEPSPYEDEEFYIIVTDSGDPGKVYRSRFSKLSEEMVEPEPTVDMVNHPPHYCQHPSGIECIQIVRHLNFNMGNAIKYLWRAGLKESSNQDPSGKQIQDLEKAAFYIKDEIARLQGYTGKGGNQE